MNEVTLIEQQGVLGMLFSSGPVVQAVLIMLVVLSLWSWAIIVAKVLGYRRAKEETSSFDNLFWDSRNFARIDESAQKLSSSPHASLFRAGYREVMALMREAEEGRSTSNLSEKDLGSIERALRRAELRESVRLERGLTFLANVASAAPFIGLFGTVWGIMGAFHGLSKTGASTIQAVAPGISEALVATAVGLAAAIPAAIGYNYFLAGLKRFRNSMDGFVEEFMNVAKRYFVKG